MNHKIFMNPGLDLLQPYPFEKLAGIKSGVKPASDKQPIDLSIGEPKHETPGFILQELSRQLKGAASYPKTRGNEDLRQAIVDWLIRRFHLPAGSLHQEHHVLPVNGTREALFAFAQCLINRNNKNAVVVSPNPFYQIYEGAALLAGASPYYVNCYRERDFIPDFSSVPEPVWKNTELVFICSPGNPTGAVINSSELQQLIELADRYDFMVAADECYSEIYLSEGSPPIGLLQAAAEMGRDDYSRCIVFHSLSKRSNVPGMRSGFVAGDKKLIDEFFRYRTYHGCAMPLFTQAASTVAWQDEEHVIENRRQYREKFDAVLGILTNLMTVDRPNASFYLWPEIAGGDDIAFARGLFAEQNVTVLPGSFLSRTANDINPGKGHLRIALVAPLGECIDAANRIKEYITKTTGK